MSRSGIVEIAVARLPHGEGLQLPAYGSGGAAGMDLRAAVPADAPLTLQPGQRALIPTGLTVAIPHGFELQVRPRSGLALKHGVTCLNTPGTVDSDYRGEIGVILINLGAEGFVVRRGDRIAQALVARHERVEWREVDSLADTLRGAGGFGSTGQD